MKDREKKDSQMVMNTKVSHRRSREPIIPIAQETQWPGANLSEAPSGSDRHFPIWRRGFKGVTVQAWSWAIRVFDVAFEKCSYEGGR